MIKIGHDTITNTPRGGEKTIGASEGLSDRYPNSSSRRPETKQKPKSAFTRLERTLAGLAVSGLAVGAVWVGYELNERGAFDSLGATKRTVASGAQFAQEYPHSDPSGPLPESARDVMKHFGDVERVDKLDPEVDTLIERATEQGLTPVELIEKSLEDYTKSKEVAYGNDYGDISKRSADTAFTIALINTIEATGGKVTAAEARDFYDTSTLAYYEAGLVEEQDGTESEREAAWQVVADVSIGQVVDLATEGIPIDVLKSSTRGGPHS